MAIPLKELLKHCKTLDLSPEVREDESPTFVLYYSTDCYVNPDGEKQVGLVCQTQFNGEYLAVTAPAAFLTRDCKFKGALFATLAQIALQTKYIQPTYNPEDGAVSFEAEIPVCDGTVTARQLEVMIGSIVVQLERYYPVIKHVMETGKTNFDLVNESSDE